MTSTSTLPDPADDKSENGFHQVRGLGPHVRIHTPSGFVRNGAIVRNDQIRYLRDVHGYVLEPVGTDASSEQSTRAAHDTTTSKEKDK